MIIPDTTQGWLDIVQEKDAEIEGLKARVEALRQIREEDKTLITELCDALEEEFGESKDLMQSQQRPWSIIQRAREATL